MVSKNGKPVKNVLAASLLVIAGAAAWILLSAGQAAALTNVDQDSTNTNVGIAVANTGGNVGVGNASTNKADANQKATANGAHGDKVAMNDATVSNDSNGSATIVTGDANASGNKADNNTVQVVDADDDNGGLVNVDQNSTNTNIGIAVANTGGNIGIGNASQNKSGVKQTADASGAGGDKIASNVADVSNDSDGDVTIVTGNASATGNVATNRTVQTLDASGGGIVLGDQNSDNLNFGVGIANTGLNIGVGNGSTNNNNGAVQLATALGGGGDKIATNDAKASNSSDGDVTIRTGNATATGNVATNDNSQQLDVADVVAVHKPSTAPMMLLFLLVGLLFVGRHPRQLGMRRRL